MPFAIGTANVAQSVLHAATLSHCEFAPVHTACAISQNVSQGSVPLHMPGPPSGPACGQCVTGSPIAGAPPWYSRQPTESPVMSAEVPTGSPAHTPKQLSIAVAGAMVGYCSLVPVQFVVTSVQ